MDCSSLYDLAKKHHLGNCIFCNPIPEMVLWENDSFSLLMDTFPVTEGHVLLTSKKHFGCYGDLPEDLKREGEALIMKLAENAIVYEHGRVGTCGVNFNACEHFHFNIVPSEQKLEHSSNVIVIDSLQSIDEHYQKFGEYLFVSSPSLSLIPPSKKIPPHFLRTMIAEHVGKLDRADWSSIDDKSMFKAGLAKAKELYHDLL